jgi:hypothetical protein
MSSRRDRNKGSRHVRLYYWMLQSPAWIDLDPLARALYLELAQRYNGVNNGEITLSCREAAKALRIGKSTAARMLEQLASHGFIAVKQKSGFNLKIREGFATRWRLTEYPTREGKDRANDFMKDATTDFMKWRPENSEHGPASGTEMASRQDTPSSQRDTHSNDTANCPPSGTDSTQSSVHLSPT